MIWRSLSLTCGWIGLACACAPVLPQAAPVLPGAAEAVRASAELEFPPTPAAEPSLPVEGDATIAAENQRIGPNDLLEIIVLEDSDLNRTVRVRGRGEISLPLLNEVPAAGRTPRELELELEARLRASYILDPHVTVQVLEAESQAVSVVGAVNRPGVFPVRGARSLLEVIALAGGLSDEAGDEVLVVRGSNRIAISDVGSAEQPSTPATLEIDLKALLESGELRHNVAVHPGDVVKVKLAGLIYVVGEVNQPGVFQLERGTGLTVVQAIAMGEGLRPMAAKGRAMVIRTSAAGEREEIPVDLGAVLAGRTEDPVLQPKDIVFVPSSTTRAVALGVVDALVRMVTLRGIF